jgi:hypothetical protein
MAVLAGQLFFTPPDNVNAFQLTIIAVQMIIPQCNSPFFFCQSGKRPLEKKRKNSYAGRAGPLANTG